MSERDENSKERCWIAKRIVFSVLLSLMMAVSAHAEPSLLKEGDVLVYKHQLDDQGLLCGNKSFDAPTNGKIYVYKIDDRKLGGSIKVGRMRWETTEKILSKDNGLRYGFPLKVGMEWDKTDFERTDHMYCKYVEKIEDVTVPAGTFKNCFKIVYKTCPDDEIEWYYPGVGVVKYEYRHHGTVTNKVVELKRISKR